MFDETLDETLDETFDGRSTGVRRAFPGIWRALCSSMGAKNYRELDAWRLADEIRRKVVAFTAQPPASRDFNYCNQVRNAAASVSANIAEGFGRYSPADFARFLSIAKGSLAEAQDRIRDGADRRYLSEDQAIELMVLTDRCDRVISRLRGYLWTCKPRRRP